nr:MAG: nonstructural protein [Canine astrovirus]
MAAFADRNAYYHSAVDAVLGLGNPKARRIIQRLPREAREALARLFPKPVPLRVGLPVRGLHYPTPGFIRIVSVTGYVERELKTYIYDTYGNGPEWVEAPCEFDRCAAFVGALSWDHDRLRTEVRNVKNDLASSLLREEILRGDLARYRHEERPSPWWGPYVGLIKKIWVLAKIIMLAFTIGAIFGRANALETNSTPVEENVPLLKAWIDSMLDASPTQWYSQRLDEYAIAQSRSDKKLFNAEKMATAFAKSKKQYDQAKKTVESMDFPFLKFEIYRKANGFLEWIRVPETHWVRKALIVIMIVMPEIPWWTVIAVPLAAWRAFKDLNPAAAMGFLWMASVTGFKFAALAVTPFLDKASTITFLFVQLIYSFDTITGVMISIPLVPAAAIFGCFLDTNRWRDLVLGHALVTLCMFACHFSIMCGLGTAPVTAVFLFFRLYKAIDTFGAITVEHRDSSGKVISKATATPNWLWRFGQAAFRAKQKFRQKIRNNVAPFVRVCPESLCLVVAGDNQGTGFRVGNDIVTAKHVVAGLKVVDISYNGSVHQAGIRVELTKDVALIKLPPQLQSMPSLKISKKPVYDIVTIVARDQSGVLVATTEGVCHGDTISYACPTRDGMSGAPVVDINGHVLGVHQTNTGYTGGAVVLTQADVQPVSQKELELLELRKQTEALQKQLADIMAGRVKVEPPKSEKPKLEAPIPPPKEDKQPVKVALPDPVPPKPKIEVPSLPEDLRKLNEELNKMAAKSETVLRGMEEFGQKFANQSLEFEKIKQDFSQRLSQVDETHVINLVRAAVQQEVQIIRDELNMALGFAQAKKGKNKKGRGARKHRPLLRKGQKMLTEEEYEELLSRGLSREELLDAVEDLVRKKIGFPEWSDPDYSSDESLFEMGYNTKKDRQQDYEIEQYLDDKYEKHDYHRDEITQDDEKYFEKYGNWDSFVQSVKLVDVSDKPEWSAYDCGPVPQAHLDKYDPEKFVLTKADVILLKDYIQALKVLVSASRDLSADAWKRQQAKITKQLNEYLFALDMAAWENGLEPFVQRMRPKKQAPKNSQKGTKPSGPQKNVN